MCGLTGFFDPSGNCSEKDMATIVKKMATTLRHRGPDDDGIWCDGDAGIAIGHRRLAIIDLSSQGHQPMVSGNGEWVIAYNGEVYNFPELHADLVKAGIPFKGRSDTEVILEGCAHWGIAETINRLVGMFAIALWNRKTRSLTLVRDRLGIKPLYWGNPEGKQTGKSGGLFLFGSELKSLTAHPRWRGGLNRDALAGFLRYGYVPTPDSIYADIHKLAPGHMLTLSPRAEPEIRAYWSLSETIEAGQKAPLNISREEAVSQIEALIMGSVKDRMVADVPLGALLSGGIDSSLLVAIITKEIGAQIDTFTVGFEETKYDESPFALEVATALGSRHHEIRVTTSSQNRSLAEEVMDQFDQPFADSSSIPSFLISKYMREHVKVAIAGDGGDEMFGGYPRFHMADRAAETKRAMGMLLPLASGLLSLSRPVAPSLHRAGSRFIRAARAVGGERLTALSCYSWPQELGSELTKKFFSISDGYRPEISSACDGVQGREFIDATIRYALPGDYLRKVDISSAAHGLEVRVPFLGNQVLECSSRINVEHKYNWKERKIILRRLAEQYLPESVTQRPKSGFGIPLDQWLTHEDKSSLRDALTSSSAAIRDIISPEYTALIMSSFVDGNRDKSKFSRFMVYQRAFILWSLERWLQRWRPSL